MSDSSIKQSDLPESIEKQNIHDPSQKSIMESQKEVIVSRYTGPLPPPEMVEKYIKLGVWEDVMSVATAEQKRQDAIVDIQRKTKDAEIENSKSLMKQTDRNQKAQIILSYLGFLTFIGLLTAGIAFSICGDRQMGWVLLGAGFAPILLKFCFIPIRK